LTKKGDRYPQREREKEGEREMSEKKRRKGKGIRYLQVKKIIRVHYRNETEIKKHIRSKA